MGERRTDSNLAECAFCATEEVSPEVGGVGRACGPECGDVELEDGS